MTISIVARVDDDVELVVPNTGIHPEYTFLDLIKKALDSDSDFSNNKEFKIGLVMLMHGLAMNNPDIAASMAGKLERTIIALVSYMWPVPEYLISGWFQKLLKTVECLSEIEENCQHMFNARIIFMLIGVLETGVSYLQEMEDDADNVWAREAIETIVKTFDSLCQRSQGAREEMKRCLRKNPQEVKRRIRHGVLDWFRGTAWKLISGVHEFRWEHPSVDYAELRSHEMSEFEKLCIVKDIHPFCYRGNVVKMSGMEGCAKFEDDKEELIAQYFTLTSSNNVEDDEREENGRTKRRLVVKNLDSKLDLKNNPREIKNLIRNGIANSKRGVVWQFISGGRDLLLANPGIYSMLLSCNEISDNLESKKLIIKDINRTLPSHDLFQEIDGPGQRSLHNVLKAYSVYDSQAGYTQGMNLIVGIILLYNKERLIKFLLIRKKRRESLVRVFTRAIKYKSCLLKNRGGMWCITTLLSGPRPSVSWVSTALSIVAHIDEDKNLLVPASIDIGIHPDDSSSSERSSNMRKRRNEEGNGGDDGRKRRWRNTAQIYERSASERQRASQQRQRVDRSVSVHIAQKIGTFVESEIHQAALCHEFNVRLLRREVSFEEWGDFMRELYRKFSRFIGLRYNLIMLHQVENLIIFGRLTYGDERIRPVLSQLGVIVNLYLDENGRHNIVQLSTQSSEGPLPADDLVFHYLPSCHGSLKDIAQKVGSIPIENAADDGICPICYNDFANSSSSDSSQLMKFPACTHGYHSAYITPWLAQNPTCPICRRKAFSDFPAQFLDEPGKAFRICIVVLPQDLPLILDKPCCYCVQAREQIEHMADPERELKLNELESEMKDIVDEENKSNAKMESILIQCTTCPSHPASQWLLQTKQRYHYNATITRLVKKEDRSNRLCIDYRWLNQSTIKDEFSTPKRLDASSYKLFLLEKFRRGNSKERMI